jgi:3-oxoacyl-[acyl-carrier protein] reductase
VADFILEMSKSAVTRKIISTLRLPIPMPPRLERAEGAWPHQPLSGRTVIVAAAPGKGLLTTTLQTLHSMGADIATIAGTDTNAIQAAASTVGYTLQTHAEGDEAPKVHALVFDATDISDITGLRALYDFFHARVGKIAGSGRCVILARPPESASHPTQVAVNRAIEGFNRSLAKEVGRKGITAQLLYVEPGADARAAAALRFFLSPNSAYVTGQPLRISQLTKSQAQPRWTAPLAGKVALVTGAARGIGASIAETLAREGAKVVCLDRPAEEEHLKQVADKIGGTTLGVDITDAEAPRKIADALGKEFGGVDIIVHNAGVTRDRTLGRMSPEWWDMTLNINLGAIIRVNELLLKEGVIRQDGRIVCLSSISGVGGNAGQTNYSTSKAGLIGYVSALSREVAGQGITVNAVAPGFIETQMTAAIPFAMREAGRRLNSLSQGGLPQDVAEVITFMSSPGAVGVSGVTLRVCGQSLVGA